MKILIACEESGIVTKEFRLLGHEAYSCDILATSGKHPEWHIQCDVTPLLKEQWDMIIAFPLCTHLAVSGARHFKQKREDGRQQQGIDFFMQFTQLSCPKIAIENPVGIMSTIWRKPDQIINPWQFGDAFSKKTCLWLKGLPKLTPTQIVDKGDLADYKNGYRMQQWITKPDSKARSKTFKGIAKAMAGQWSVI